MVVGNPNYQACCLPVAPGGTIAATCTVIAQSVSAAGIVSCPHTMIGTTDSVNMAAPTDYKPAYATAPVTSDTAGQSYNSGVASAITTWVTETASPDCAVPSSTSVVASSTASAEPTYPTSSSAPSIEPTYPVSSSSLAEPTYPPSSSAAATSAPSSSAAPASTCACPDAASSAPAPAETSDTHGESYSSASDAPTNNYGECKLVQEKQVS
jgi:hypothetical protein